MSVLRPTDKVREAQGGFKYFGILGEKNFEDLQLTSEKFFELWRGSAIFLQNYSGDFGAVQAFSKLSS